MAFSGAFPSAARTRSPSALGFPVPDRETQELMGTFYVKWLGGLDKPEALRQAQLQEREVVRQRYGKDLPFYWGAFVLVSR